MCSPSEAEIVGRDAILDGPTRWLRSSSGRCAKFKHLLPMLLDNSLIQLISSLFLEKPSLLICSGNCARGHCSAAVSSHEIGSGSFKIAKFPVKFPVSREFTWRQVQSALPRQPTSRGWSRITSPLAQDHQFRSPTLSDGCRFSKQILAGARGTGQDAPIAGGGRMTR